ncbi:MAG: hypothetical protein C0478_07965 [Planctomyces sp.]|nr:hypothetical protein [Planctomyces sp.]
MDHAPTPWQLLYELERNGVVSGETGRLREFQEACCQFLAEFLPRDSEEWLRVARAYRFGEATASELEEARVAAWKHLGSASCEVSNPKVAAVRAVLGLLYPDDWEYREDEPSRIGRFEALDYFLDYSNRLVDRRDDQARLLRELFPELAASSAEPKVAPDFGMT